VNEMRSPGMRAWITAEQGSNGSASGTDATTVSIVEATDKFVQIFHKPRRLSGSPADGQQTDVQ